MERYKKKFEEANEELKKLLDDIEDAISDYLQWHIGQELNSRATQEIRNIIRKFRK
jgi:hypothetical protein